MTVEISKNYVQLSEREHVRMRSGIYVGSIVNKVSEMFTVKDSNMVLGEAEWNPALQKLFDEVISNSVDEHIRNGSVKTIKVNIHRLTGEISIEDDGGIPVVKHSEYGKWIPEMIFSELRTGSNFDDENRIGAGTNGLGAKLTACLSSKFTVETSDGKNLFLQTYTNGLESKSIPVIQKSNTKGTKITFTPDYKLLKTEMSEGNYNQIARRCYDVAGCNPNIKVYLNDELIKIKSFNQYASMYVKDTAVDEFEGWSICLGANNDDTFKQVSFVNGINTYEGGTHVDYVVNQITSKVREFIKKKHKIDVRPNNIKQQLFIVMKCTINAPTFNSQTKETLVTDVKDFGSEYTVSNKFLKKIIDSEVIQKVLDWAEGEQRKQDLAELRKLNRKVDKNNAVKRIAKFDDASTKDRMSAMCVFTEGDSAGKSVLSARDPRTVGVYPLKGKLLNVRDIAVKRMAANEEFQSIMTILGLKIGFDVDKRDLRFGKIVIGTDFDHDGKHISGLFINMINEFWPSLLKDGYVYRLRTPLLVAYGKTKRQKDIEFFSQEEYNEWLTKNDESKYNIKYFKGLGGWSSTDFKRFMSDSEYLTQITYTDECERYIDVAFDKKKANDRKDWLIGEYV